MSSTTELRDELKARFYPLAFEKGFALDKGQGPYFRSFRKVQNAELFVFELQWDKYHRPRFVINFSRSPAKSIEFGGRQLSTNEINPAHTHKQGRLCPRKIRFESTRSWFCQDRHLLLRLLGVKNRPANKVVDQAIEAFLELENFWATGQKSERIGYYPDLYKR